MSPLISAHPAPANMLKQILRDMYVDPEILSGLDDTQKQTLFCKMREEQIRRWRLWDQKHERLESAADHPPQPPAVVQFRHGADGEPWVWVMGEHENDRSIDAILAEESKLRARQLAEIETKELRKSFVAELVHDATAASEADAATTTTKETGAVITTPDILPNRRKMSADGLLPKIEDDLEIYCSVDEIRQRIGRPAPEESVPAVPAARPIPPAAPAIKADVLREITRNNRQPPAQKVSAKIALWEKRVIGEKTNEIYRLLQEKHQVDAAEAESAARKREAEWQEQEARAKVAELQMRDIARKARDEHRRSIIGVSGVGGDVEQRDQSPLSSSSASSLSSNSLDGGISGGGNAATSAAVGCGSGSPPSSIDSTVSRPPSLDAVVRWYRAEEFGRGGGIDAKQKRPYSWFHGMLSRPDAERLLADEPAGTFLVRLSDKIWGYAISYRDAERCKHYLVDASGGSYQFLGANQLSHDSLSEYGCWRTAWT